MSNLIDELLAQMQGRPIAHLHRDDDLIAELTVMTRAQYVALLLASSVDPHDAGFAVAGGDPSAPLPDRRGTDADAIADDESPATAKPATNGKLTGSDVRNAMRVFVGTFTLGELAAEVEHPVKELRSLFNAALAAGVVREAGRYGRAMTYEFVKPDTPSGPQEHPRKRPPEKEPPAGVEARATGMPVRIRTERSDRRGRSTPGQRQKIIQRDRAWERQEAAKKARAEADRAKAQKDPKWKRNK